MKVRKNKKISVGILVDSPFPHPSLKDKREIMGLCFNLSDTVFGLFTDLVLAGEYSAGEKLVKAVRRIPRLVQLAFAAESASEYRNQVEHSMDTLIELRYWLKEIQMKYLGSELCDDSVDKVNELFMVLTYISGKFRTETIKMGYLTVN